MKDLISLYQCPGCMHGPDAESCDALKLTDEGCATHRPGTMGFGIGTFYLGMPKGFNRLGHNPPTQLYIVESLDVAWVPSTRMYNIPAWKHLDEHGNTLVRFYSPRLNYGYSVVVRGNCMNELPGVVEITQEHIDNMD